jgi:2,4-dienoyl-CoA reductase-like NADH-dependent reductase (Old Yellow Enzyme family)
MSLLFSPLTIKDISFRNRIVVSPMCQYTSVDGFAQDWHLVHLGSRAVGGAGLVIQEATAVSPEGRISYSDMGIWKDEHIDMLKRITSFIHEQGAIAGIQLAHAGRKASTEKPWISSKQIQEGEHSWPALAPSPLPFREGEKVPVPLTIDGIQKVINDFKAAAERAKQAGYKVVEIHAAHGYLIHQFLSPLSNQREDAYGGSFENRIRLLLEVIAAIQTVWPSGYPLFVRVSATDWATKGGWDIEQTVKLSSLLKDKGVDLVDTSTGGLLPHVTIPVAPGYQVQFAGRIKKETGILTGAVGLITEAEQAEQILQEKQADVIILARQLLRDPYFPLHAAAQLNAEIKWPDQYQRAQLQK